MERDFDAGSRGRSDARREHRRHSLFDDPDLSLDTPGVLDAVFDEIEPPAMAEPKEISERRQPEPFEDEFESRDRFAPKGLDDLFPDEADDEEAEEAVPERVESGEALDTEEEEKRARRRRRPRRRRRSGRRDQEPAEEGVREAAEKEEFEEEDVAEPRGSAAPVRDSRSAEKLDEDEELEDEERFDGDEEDEEEGSGERLKLKHKKIPTWQQAVDAIIAVNMESRAKNPSGSGGGGRGRGRRWRK
jgi:hypothetical protein